MSGTIHIVGSASWSDDRAAELRASGFVVLRATNRCAAERLARRRPADLVVIVAGSDRSLDPPGSRTSELLAWLRENTSAAIAVLETDTDDERILALFAEGADDVIPADCSPALFRARVRALLRRLDGLPGASASRISIGDVTVEADAQRVLVGDQPVHLTPLEFSLLCTLMRDPGVVYSREDLLDSVWGSRDVAVERTIDAHIWKLRRKIEPGGRPRHILSVPRLGYRFRRPEEPAARQAALAG